MLVELKKEKKAKISRLFPAKPNLPVNFFSLLAYPKAFRARIR
jgi:hypothetical protein